MMQGERQGSLEGRSAGRRSSWQPGSWKEMGRLQQWPQPTVGRAGRNVSWRGNVGGKPGDARWGAPILRYLEEEGTEHREEPRK